MVESEVTMLAEEGRFLGHRIKGHIEETHISWVILSKGNVFKIKKPVKLSFLDFSTLAKRKRYCIRELSLNQRFSPIYLDVLPVQKDGEKWTIGQGSGSIVEYVVRMKRMISARRMDKLLQTKKVSSNDILLLAKVVSSFHSGSEVIMAPFLLAKAKSMFNDIRSIIRVANDHLGDEYSEIIKKSIKWSNTFLSKHADRIRERIALGFKRDVHGDLHSGNIFLYKQPILYDCIEFNDSYRRMDVINEVAFFCMDLEAYREGRLARLFQREYQRHFDCFQNNADRRLFTYYKCYRANVRAKVHALSIGQAHDAENSQLHINALRTYLRLMRRYMK